MLYQIDIAFDGIINGGGGKNTEVMMAYILIKVIYLKIIENTNYMDYNDNCVSEIYDEKCCFEQWSTV